MKRSLNGAELAGYIKERQAKQVRNLRQEYTIAPKLAIVAVEPTEPSQVYMRLKQTYGDDILIDVEILDVSLDTVRSCIQSLNERSDVHGIIIQLPLPVTDAESNEIIALIEPTKDVDGLRSDEYFTPATALAIDWLVAGYNIDLRHKSIALVGNGKLVGAPLAKLWQRAGYQLEVIDEHTTDATKRIQQADVIVTATGVPGLISSAVVRPNAVVIDAGTASERGKLVGDVAEDVRQRNDVLMTPERGGVGPLTVAALFDNVIKSARQASMK